MNDSSLGEMVKAALSGLAEQGASSGGAADTPEPIASDELYKLADAVEHVSKSLREPDSEKRKLLKRAAGKSMEPGKGPGTLPVSEQTGAGGSPLKPTGAGATATPKPTGNGTTLPTNEGDEKRAGALHARNQRVAARLKKAAEEAAGDKSQAALVATNQAAINATKKDVKRVPTKDVNQLFRTQAMKDNALQQAFKNCGGAKTAAVMAKVTKTAGARALLSDLVSQVERHRHGNSGE